MPGVKVNPSRGFGLQVDNDIVHRRVSVAETLFDPVPPVGVVTMQLMEGVQRPADGSELLVERTGGIGEKALQWNTRTDMADQAAEVLKGR